MMNQASLIVTETVLICLHVGERVQMVQKEEEDFLCHIYVWFAISAPKRAILQWQNLVEGLSSEMQSRGPRNMRRLPKTYAAE